MAAAASTALDGLYDDDGVELGREGIGVVIVVSSLWNGWSDHFPPWSRAAARDPGVLLIGIFLVFC